MSQSTETAASYGSRWLLKGMILPGFWSPGGLQSANEELETAKEELQSLNEELTTVNSQLEDKVDELDKAHNDLLNLINSTDIATLFLDTDLRIQRFTPTAANLLNLIVTDVGRPIGHFAPRLTNDSLAPDARRVLEHLGASEKEVHSEEGRLYLRRIAPYRTGENRIEGVAVTFVDVTERKALETGVAEKDVAVRAAEQRLRAIVNTVPEAIITIDRQGLVQSSIRRPSGCSATHRRRSSARTSPS